MSLFPIISIIIILLLLFAVSLHSPFPSDSHPVIK